MAEIYHITYIPPTTLDPFTGVNLSENMGFGADKTKLSTVGGNAKRAEMGLPQYRKGLNKFISKSSIDVSHFDGKETLQSVKAAAAGTPTSPPDYSEKLTHSLEQAEIQKKETGLTEEQLEEIIRKKRAQREALEKWRQQKREAAGADHEVSIQATGSVEQAKLSSVLVDESPPVYDKQEKVAQTYSQPTPDTPDTGDGPDTGGGDSGTASEPALDSEA